MLPGLHAALMLGNARVVYATNAASVTPWEDLGSPAVVNTYQVVVSAGAIISSSGHPTPAMSLNFPAGSTVYLYNLGEITGAGGAGGGGDRGRRSNASATEFVGGGGGGGTGRPGGAGGIAATAPLSTATDGAAGTDTTPGAPGVNDNVAGSAYELGADPVVGGDALDVTTAITLYLVNAAGLIVAGGTGGMGGFQDSPLPGGANDPVAGYGPPTGIVASATLSGWAIKLASGATVVPVSGVNSTRVKGAYVGSTSS